MGACIDLNLSKSIQSTAGLKALKSAANGHYYSLLTMLEFNGLQKHENTAHREKN